jgi:hypothetical protein
LFKQIHEIVFHGKGGYSWSEIYNMPIWLRRFTFNEIQNFYSKEKEEYDKSLNKGKTTVIDSKGQVQAPEFLKTPTYK